MRKLTTAEFIERARKVHGDRYDYSKTQYVNSRVKVCIICKQHGEFWQAPDCHAIRNGTGCPSCGGVHRPSTQEWIDRATIRHNGKYDYSQVVYVSNKTRLRIICPDHGAFMQTPASHLSNGAGCPFCSESELERVVADYLRGKGIPFERQKKFPGCARVRQLAYDFYLPRHNTIIECDGRQHGNPVCAFDMASFVEQEERDTIKERFAEDHNIEMLRIPWRLTKQAGEIIDSSICEWMTA